MGTKTNGDGLPHGLGWKRTKFPGTRRGYFTRSGGRLCAISQFAWRNHHFSSRSFPRCFQHSQYLSHRPFTASSHSPGSVFGKGDCFAAMERCRHLDAGQNVGDGFSSRAVGHLELGTCSFHSLWPFDVKHLGNCIIFPAKETRVLGSSCGRFLPNPVRISDDRRVHEHFTTTIWLECNFHLSGRASASVASEKF